MCQYHSVNDVAPPVCEADRHVKQARQKKGRGLRDIERQAEPSPTTEAQIGVDDSLAMRTVMRDEGTYPLEPPGVPLSQQLQLMAAAVERVKAMHPAALLTRLSRRLAVVNLFQTEDDQFVMFFSWVHQIAHL
jgi:hypothetical protein